MRRAPCRILRWRALPWPGRSRRRGSSPTWMPTSPGARPWAATNARRHRHLRPHRAAPAAFPDHRAPLPPPFAWVPRPPSAAAPYRRWRTAPAQDCHATRHARHDALTERRVQHRVALAIAGGLGPGGDDEDATRCPRTGRPMRGGARLPEARRTPAGSPARKRDGSRYSRQPWIPRVSAWVSTNRRRARVMPT